MSEKLEEFGKKVVEEATEARDSLAEGAAKNPKRFVNIVAGVVLLLLALVVVARCAG